MVLINNGYNFMAFAGHNKCKYDTKIIHESLKAYFQWGPFYKCMFIENRFNRYYCTNTCIYIFVTKLSTLC